MPGLINAHIHLELSHLTAVQRPGPGQVMCDWIEGLLRSRGESVLTASEREQCRQQALHNQHQAGVIVLGDIGNEPQPPQHGLPVVFPFREFLAPTGAATEAAKAVLSTLSDSVAATAHAPYSTSPELLRVLKKRTTRLGQVFSLHVAESPEEIEFLRSAAGSFRDFLERRGAWDGTFLDNGDDLEGTVMYLRQLGLLDSRTLCVHCVHITENEIRLLASSGAHVCLCPGSNRFLRVGKAPVQHMLKHGLLPALGTDSIASNERLDLWREMAILREDHPGIDPGKILEMATLGGAAALQCADDFGSLSPGRKATFLEVHPQRLERVASESQLTDILTLNGRPPKVSWIGCR
jgi:cytosine/adenosine deaminase-related metal-dependent hydrolase